MKSLHTFAICAYKESPYLEECICSIKKQVQKSEVLIATSTPNEYIQSLSKKYNVPLYINTGEKGITQDWNFAYKMADSELVTIAHQDDVYCPDYSQIVTQMAQSVERPLILFTDYAELRDGKIVDKSKLLMIKRIMLMPLRCKIFQKSRFVRRRSLSLGCPICCPAVTFLKKNLPDEIFAKGFRSDEDWEAWEKLSKLEGSFAYSKEIGMYHRIHSESETSIILGDNARVKEDFIMFKKFWPTLIAKLLVKLYSNSEKSNEL